MSEAPSTPFSNRCDILGELWINYKTDEEFEDFFQYNDLGMPLAYSVSADIIKPNVLVEGFVNETFDLLLSALEIEDEGFESLDDILGLAE